MNMKNNSVRIYPLLMLLGIAVSAQGRGEESPGSSPSEVRAAPSMRLPSHVTAPADYRVLTVQEMLKLFHRPNTASELLRNLQIVWENNLLAQPAFYEEETLMKVFNGTRVTWQKPMFDDSSKYSNRSATVTLEGKVFPNATIRVAGIHHVAKAEAVPALNLYIPAYIEDKGQIEMVVDSLPGFTWGGIKSAFGTGAEDQGPSIPTDGGTDAGTASRGNMWMRYLHPGEDPTKFGAADQPIALFEIRSDRPRVPEAPSSRRLDKPKDSDEVKYFRINDSLTQYAK